MAARTILIALCATPLAACDSRAGKEAPPPTGAAPPATAPGNAPGSAPANTPGNTPGNAPGKPTGGAPQSPPATPPAAHPVSAPGSPAAQTPAPETTGVAIAGQKFTLEAALDDSVRIKGLGGRTEIAPRGGMLFVFPYALELSFVMRDCPIPIDIAFLDSAGRVVAKHTMQPEAPRTENETPQAYENRLKKYGSRYAAQFAVEVKAGTLDALGVKEGDLLRFDAEGLKRRAR